MKTLTELLTGLWYDNKPLRHKPPLLSLSLMLLWPLSQLFVWLAQWRRKVLLQKQNTLPVPVIVIGNIAVGGTGKTPLLCALAQALQQRGYRVGIISRGYGGSHRGSPRRVGKNDNADVTGDEPLLLASMTDAPVFIGADRLAAAQALLAQCEVDVILSDDGLQHYALPRQMEIAVIDGERGLGNGFCLPAGPLREPPQRLREVTAVVVNVGSAAPPAVFRADQHAVQLLPQCWVRLSDGEEAPLDSLPAGITVHAVAGIGNPARFFASLRSLGLQVIEHPFPDHHRFVATDLQFADDLPVVMTEKDAVKCHAFAPAQAQALRVSMSLPNTLLRIVENSLPARKVS